MGRSLIFSHNRASDDFMAKTSQNVCYSVIENIVTAVGFIMNPTAILSMSKLLPRFSRAHVPVTLGIFHERRAIPIFLYIVNQPLVAFTDKGECGSVKFFIFSIRSDIAHTKNHFARVVGDINHRLAIESSISVRVIAPQQVAARSIRFVMSMFCVCALEAGCRIP